MNPYAIDGPALLSFSGGRTSAFMLRKILDVGLAPDVHVMFANTGKEREETLVFVRDVAAHFGVPVTWVERLPGGGVREVTFETASRNGEPFAQLIAERKFLPNPVMRFCTTELKIRTMKGAMLARGYEHWTNVVGLRADEPGRVAKQRAGEGRERWDLAFPMFDAGHRKDDVLLFWKRQPFDLQLRSWEGNCDLCFLKGIEKRRRIMEDTPHAADWWLEQEAAAAAAGKPTATFRSDTPSYAALARAARAQLRLFGNDLFTDPPSDDPTDLGDCACTAD